MEKRLNAELVARSINFHGQQLQKVWESECGEGDLQAHGVSDPDFTVYQQRQKHLSFQDRGKRLKLHQFITKMADSLFNEDFTHLATKTESKLPVTEKDLYAVLPPYESFITVDKPSRVQHFFQCVKQGDLLIGSITSKSASGLVVKVLCTYGLFPRCISDLTIKVFCPTTSLIAAVDKKNLNRSFLINDIICCEVLEMIPDTEKLIGGMKGVYCIPELKPKLGLFHSDDFPQVYKQAQEAKGEPYEDILQKSVGFSNPSNISVLLNDTGLDSKLFSNMKGLRGRFPESEYAGELRQVQAGKWAYRSVADGIDHFKAGRHTEAFQCLNKALSIDPKNIEGLVARGALYANNGSFEKAVTDFESALKLNPNHSNARTYLGETLVAYGRSYEDDKKWDEALKCYQSCLTLIPDHGEAQNSIEYLKSKHLNGGSKTEESESVLSGLSLSKAQGVKDTLKQLLGAEELQSKEERTSARKKKKDKKSRRRHHRSSSSSSTSSSGSSSTSISSSSTDSSSGSSQDSHHKKKHKKKSEHKDKSLSPLSKRMAIMDSAAQIEGMGAMSQRGHYNPPAVPYTFPPLQVCQVMERGVELREVAPSYQPPPSKPHDKETDYEQRVRKFLEQTKGDSDYEEKVRKFLDETAKWKKDKKAMEEKAKKKKKKDRKAKSKSLKKKRRKSRKAMKEFEEKKIRDVMRREKRRRSAALDDDDEVPDFRGLLSLGSIPDLEEIQSKLASYYAKVEKGVTPSTSKKKENSEKKESSKGKSSPKVLYIHHDDETKNIPEPSSRQMKKKVDIFADSPPPLPDKSPPSIAAPLTSKFKMQIGNASSRFKKKEKIDNDKEPWEDEMEEKRILFMKEEVSGRVGMSSQSPQVGALMKKAADKKREMEENFKGPAILDKLGGFRINPSAETKKDDIAPQKRKLRARPVPSDSDSSAGGNRGGPSKKRTRSPSAESPSSRSISRSPQPRKYSSDSPPVPKKYSSDSGSSSYHKGRSRSKSGSYRSRSRRYRSSESGTDRSRSYTRSRSRSRSGEYHRRSRSRSDERHHYRNKYQNRYPRNRGTYYRPRFQNYNNKNQRGGYIPRGRNRGYNNQNRGGRGYIPRMRGRGRPRFFHHNYRDNRDHYRRYDRGMSRSDDDRDSPMRKVDAAKERIDKLLAEDKHHTGPLSEGEERDDDYGDRKDYDGKWSSKDTEGPRLPPDSGGQDDKFMNDKQKKEDKRQQQW